MLRDQNRIELQVRNSIYEEFILRLTNTGYCLPGSLMATAGDPQEYFTNTIDSQAKDIETFETIVLLENALLGKSMNAKSFNGERTLARRAVEGDILLLRAIPDVYTIGEPVYATQTPHGIYVTTEVDGKFIGWAVEDFEVTPAMMDLIDDSTTERPSTINLNGAIVNLLRVRIGGKKRIKPAAPVARFTVTANGGSTEDTTLLTISFTKFSELLTTDLTAEEITLSSGLSKGILTKIDTATYTLAVTPTVNGTQTVMINKPNVSAKPVAVRVFLTEATTPPPEEQIAGYWGVTYQHLTQPPPFSTDFSSSYPVPPTAEEILALGTKLNVITGDKRDITVKFALDEENWRAATGSAGSFAMEGMGRGFLITAWGDATAIETNGSPAHTIYSPFSVVIDGKTYTGYIKNGSPAVYSGTAETIFKF